MKLNILYTDIGRGHPFYLDGIIKALRTNYPGAIEIDSKTVFDISRGISLMAWKLVRFLYLKGSQGGIWGRLYRLLRKDKKPGKLGIYEKILGRDICRYYKRQSGPALVAHPLLVSILSDTAIVYYQHGELSVPDISLVYDAKMIFVPHEGSAEQFRNNGFPDDKIFVGGLCIENDLVKKAKDMYEKRLSRLNQIDSLTGGFFSSGAEPIGHVEKIIGMLKSLSKTDHKAILFCRKDGKLFRKAMAEFGDSVLTIDDDKTGRIMLAAYKNREEEDNITTRLFDRLDYFVAPSHERTNWALGLGIPMFILHPLIGPFSPINRNILINNKVAGEIKTNSDADKFAKQLDLLFNNGELVKMALNGFGNNDINGFENIGRKIMTLPLHD